MVSLQREPRGCRGAQSTRLHLSRPASPEAAALLARSFVREPAAGRRDNTQFPEVEVVWYSNGKFPWTHLPYRCRQCAGLPVIWAPELTGLAKPHPALREYTTSGS